MGVFGFVAAGGGSIGVTLGGILTDSLDWHWIFLVNFPIGLLVVALSLRLLPAARMEGAVVRLDVAGAITVTGSLMLAVYAIVNGNQAGWTSSQTLGLLATSAVLLGVFLGIESRVESPLMPLRLFRLRNLATSNVVGILWAASMFAWFFLSALYMQLVLGYTPLEVGLAFLPANLIMAAFSLGLSAKLVMRFGIKPPLAVGLLVAAAGMALFVRAPVDGNFVTDVLPSMILLGFGAGTAFNPVLLAAMSDVDPSEAGLASGVVNTSFMMGGAVGLAVLASLAQSRTDSLRASGDGALTASPAATTQRSCSARCSLSPRPRSARSCSTRGRSSRASTRGLGRAAAGRDGVGSAPFWWGFRIESPRDGGNESVDLNTLQIPRSPSFAADVAGQPSIDSWWPRSSSMGG